LITISLILIKDMQYPFAGNPHVGPEAFEVFLRSIPSSRWKRKVGGSTPPLTTIF